MKAFFILLFFFSFEISFANVSLGLEDLETRFQKIQDLVKSGSNPDELLSKPDGNNWI